MTKLIVDLLGLAVSVALLVVEAAILALPAIIVVGGLYLLEML